MRPRLPSVLDRVLDEVLQHLAELVGVAGQIGEVGGDIAVQTDPAAGEQRREPGGDLLDSVASATRPEGGMCSSARPATG